MTERKSRIKAPTVLEGYVTRPELAKQLGITPVTLSQWLDDGLPYVKLGRSYYFKSTDVSTWIDKQIHVKNLSKPIKKYRG